MQVVEVDPDGKRFDKGARAACARALLRGATHGSWPLPPPRTASVAAALPRGQLGDGLVRGHQCGHLPAEGARASPCLVQPPCNALLTRRCAR
jgi:hypothetical protein